MNSIGQIIKKYRKENKLSQPDLANELAQYGYSIKQTAISSWENGVSMPNAEQFLICCKVLGITDIYSVFIGHNPNNPLSQLNAKGKEKALDYIDLLLKSGDYASHEVTVLSKLREIRLFTLPASAGTGEFLDSDDFEIIEVGDEVPMDADFGIRIHGDSMEPQFINGQIVWVKQTSELYSGDIGIFYLNGDAYCKKLAQEKNKTYLVSLNQKYEPIEINRDSNFEVFGKVIG